MKYQVWVKWKYCEPQVEELFSTKEEAIKYALALAASQNGNSNFVDWWVQSEKFTQYLEDNFSEDF